MKICPFCGAELESDAVFCHHCMHPLAEKEALVPYRRRSPWAMLVAAAAVVAIVLVALLLPPKAPLPAASGTVTTRQMTLTTTRLFGTSITEKPTSSGVTTVSSVTEAVDTATTLSQETTDASLPTSETNAPSTDASTTVTTIGKPTTVTTTLKAATTTPTTAKTTTTTRSTTTTKSTTTTTAVSSQFYYTIADGEVTITGLASGVYDVLIPNTLEGYPVTAIGEGAFKNRSFESIVLPDTLKTIGKKAFYECNSFKEITIPRNVTHIGCQAFYLCRKLETVYFGATSCASSPNAFENVAARNLVFSPEVRQIPEVFIYDSIAFDHFYIPKTITHIPDFIDNDISFVDSQPYIHVYYEGSESDWQSVQIDGTRNEFRNAQNEWFYNCDYEQYKDYFSPLQLTKSDPLRRRGSLL